MLTVEFCFVFPSEHVCFFSTDAASEREEERKRIVQLHDNKVSTSYQLDLTER